MAHTVYLALGSNLGDRLARLRFAVSELELRGVNIERKSKIYESASVESGGEGDFLNAVVRARTELTPTRLLEVCQEVEFLAGREKPQWWNLNPGAKRPGSRTLDIDILTFDDRVSCVVSLQLPHPRALFRPFVLRPLLDVLGESGVADSGLDW